MFLSRDACSFASTNALVLKSDDFQLKRFREGSEMKTSLSEDSLSATSERLRSSNREFMAGYPGEEGRRQPVHTVYGGAHLFRADSARRLGQVAERSLIEYAPDFVVF